VSTTATSRPISWIWCIVRSRYLRGSLPSYGITAAAIGFYIWDVFICVIYRNRCWYTYDFVVRGSISKYVGYRGYKVCYPAVANPTVEISSDAAISYRKQAPDISADYYGETIHVGSVSPSWIEFNVIDEGVRIRVDGSDIPPSDIDDSLIDRDVFSVMYGIPTNYGYGIDMLYYWQNNSGTTIYVKGEVYSGGTMVCQVSDSVNSGSYKNLYVLCDTSGSDGEIRTYKIKWYISTDNTTWYHVETRLISVYYYAPRKTVGDIVFRPNKIIYDIENYTGKQFRNYGQSGMSYDYVLMVCSMDTTEHELKDDLGKAVYSRGYKCVWGTYTDTYLLGVNSRQLYLDSSPYKTVNVYGYGDGKVWSVESKSGYNVYTIKADNAVVISVGGDYAFDFVNGVKDVDVSQTYQYSILWIRGWGVKNLSEYFAGYIMDGNQYVSKYDRSYVTLYFVTAYSGRFEVEKDGVVVYSTNIDVPAGGTYQYGPLSRGEWSILLNWGSVASFKIVGIGTKLTLDVQPL